MEMERIPGAGRMAARGPAPYRTGRLIVAATVLIAANAIAGTPPCVLAEGGQTHDMIVGDVKYRVHTFATNGTLKVILGGEIEYLLIGGGGGGGGGWEGGGGGAGGFLEGRARVTNGLLRVAVGAGGGGKGKPQTRGPASNGGHSSIVGIAVAAGGGGGAPGQRSESAISVGSGGGGAHGGPLAGGDGMPGQGHRGGNGIQNGGGGGGGGAGGPGANTSNRSSRVAGGIGRTSSISGKAVVYAAGGSGRPRQLPGNGSDGTAGTGNGGEAGAGGREGSNAGGNGGSGIVIIRYEMPLTVMNRPVAGVTSNSAVFGGWLVSTGASPAAVGVLWGLDAGSTGGRWSCTNWWQPGEWTNNSHPAMHMTGLTPDRYYTYTMCARNAQTNFVADFPVSFMTGAVAVKASRRESTEDLPGEFVITRPDTATHGPLAVSFTLGGTGVNGLDYDRLKSPVLIPAGASEVRLPLAPIFNFGSRQSKLVELTLAPGPYLIDAKNIASILTRAQ